MTPQTRSLLQVKLRLRNWSRDEIATATFTEGFDGHAHGITVRSDTGKKAVFYPTNHARKAAREKVSK